MDKIVNTAILKHPLNWIIVLLMLLLAGAAGHYLFALAGITPKSIPTSPGN